MKIAPINYSTQKQSLQTNSQPAFGKFKDLKQIQRVLVDMFGEKLGGDCFVKIEELLPVLDIFNVKGARKTLIDLSDAGQSPTGARQIRFDTFDDVHPDKPFTTFWEITPKEMTPTKFLSGLVKQIANATNRWVATPQETSKKGFNLMADFLNRLSLPQ